MLPDCFATGTGEETRVRVCFPFVGDSIGGSHLSTLLLIEGLNHSRYQPVIVVHEDGPLSEHLRARGSCFELLSLPSYAGDAPNVIAIGANMVRNLPRLVGFMRRHQIDIVHANDLRMNLRMGSPSARESGVTSKRCLRAHQDKLYHYGDLWRECPATRWPIV